MKDKENFLIEFCIGHYSTFDELIKEIDKLGLTYQDWKQHFKTSLPKV